MASRELLDAWVTQTQDIRTVALNTLDKALGSFAEDVTVGELRGLVLDAMPDVIRFYGDLAAANGADFYENCRASSNARLGAHATRMARQPTMGEIRREVEAALESWGNTGVTADSMRGALGNVADQFITGMGRETIALNASRDAYRPRWARVPSGPTCAFCTVLASRGAIYGSEGAASKGFHGHCDCVPTPMWKGDKYPRGYEPDQLHAQYIASRNRANSGDLNVILAQMRKDYGMD